MASWGTGFKSRILDFEPARARPEAKCERKNHTIASGRRNQVVPKSKD